MALIPSMRQLDCRKPQCTRLDLSGQERFGERVMVFRPDIDLSSTGVGSAAWWFGFGGSSIILFFGVVAWTCVPQRVIRNIYMH